MQDNDELFLTHFYGIVNSVDELCSVEITKIIEGYKFRIATSLPKYNSMLIEELLNFCNLFKIHLEMGKSIKTSSVISFEIKIN